MIKKVMIVSALKDPDGDYESKKNVDQRIKDLKAGDTLEVTEVSEYFDIDETRVDEVILDTSDLSICAHGTWIFDIDSRRDTDKDSVYFKVIE